MRLSSYFYMSVLCAAVAHAAPLVGVSGGGDNALNARATEIEDVELLLRALELEGEDLMERDDLLDELESRGLLATGLKWALNKVPKGHSFKTPTAKYSGHEVNQAAKDALRKAQAGVKDKGYPKPGSGFPKSQAKADPTKGEGVAFHAPIRPKNAKGKPTGPYPGPDRVIVHKKPGKSRFDAHVSYHDGKKQVPVGTGAKNHPFSAGKRKTSGGEKQRKGRRRK